MPLPIRTGALPAALRIILQGQEGVGKTTWASQCPNALFLTCEDGGGILDYARVVCETWQTLREAVWTIQREGAGEYRTLVIDTIDSFERLLWADLCDKANCDTIEEVGGGFGKGYIRAMEAMQQLAADLDVLRHKQGINVILLAHVHVRPFNDPNGPSYDRYEMRMHKGTSAMWASWADAQLFACFDVTVLKTGKKGRVQGAETMEKGKATKVERVIYATKDAAFDAKNRHGLPDELPMDFRPFAAAIKWDAHRKQKVNEADPNAPHDPSFTDDERKRFNAKIGDMGISYDNLKAWCLSVGKPKPSALPQARRDALLTALAGDARAKFDAFITPAGSK